jgi:MFS family permease
LKAPRLDSLTLDRLPTFLAGLLCATLTFDQLAMPAAPQDPGAIPAFASAFAGLAARERLVSFPLGVGAAIVALVVLLRHGALGSRRGKLEGAAILLLFLSGVLVTLVVGPVARDIARLAIEAPWTAVSAQFARWRLWHSVELAGAWAVLALFLSAGRQPLPVGDEASSFGLSPHHRTLLFLLGTATFFQGYDNFIVSMALPYIGRDLGASTGGLGLALSAIRVGALVSIVFGWIADRSGRRGMLLITIVAYTMATAATGLSRGMGDFVALQLVAQIFLVTELSVAQVVVTEEFPVNFRSVGQGLLGTFGALGAGLAAVLFPLFQATPLGWRGLYFVGIAPLLLTAYLRRSLPETARWHRARGRGETTRARVRELVDPATRPRFVCLLAVSFAIGCAAAPAFGFASYHATEAFGWSPTDVSAMVLLGGGLGMAGWFCWGLLAERAGRRSVGAVALAGTGAATWLYYATPWLAPAFASLVFMEAGAMVALNALGTEVFPTRLRSTAKSWITNAGVVGAVAGMGAVGLFSAALGGADRVIRLCALLPVLSAACLLAVPETRGLELEEISEASPTKHVAASRGRHVVAGDAT